MLAFTNLSLFALHFASATYVFVNRNQVPDRFRKIKIFRQQVAPAGGNSMEYSFTNELVTTIDLTLLISTFFLITSLFHLSYFLGRNGWYARFLQQGWNPVRWIEYSITATIMVVIISLSGTLQDISSLIMVIVATSMIMLLGAAIERAMIKNDKFQADLLLKIGWILQIAVYLVIGIAFVTTIQAVNKKLTAEEAKDTIPDWVYVILIGQLVFFSCFGIVSLVQFYRKFRGNKIDFVKYERVYHMLSLAAKLTLGWVFFIGATNGRGATDAPA